LERKAKEEMLAYEVDRHIRRSMSNIVVPTNTPADTTTTTNSTDASSSSYFDMSYFVPDVTGMFNYMFGSTTTTEPAQEQYQTLNDHRSSFSTYEGHKQSQNNTYATPDTKRSKSFSYPQPSSANSTTSAGATTSTTRRQSLRYYDSPYKVEETSADGPVTIVPGVYTASTPSTK
jgi:hypothetical protein